MKDSQMMVPSINKRYYAGDENLLRNNSFIYTTALSIGVNCTKKHMLVKFWENEKLIYEYQM